MGQRRVRCVVRRRDYGALPVSASRIPAEGPNVRPRSHFPGLSAPRRGNHAPRREEGTHAALVHCAGTGIESVRPWKRAKRSGAHATTEALSNTDGASVAYSTPIVHHESRFTHYQTPGVAGR